LNDWLLVVDDRDPDTRIFDTSGRLVMQLAEQVEGDHGHAWGATFAVGRDLVIVTYKHVMRVDPSGRVVWKIGPPINTFVAGDDVVVLPDGDLVIANYGQIDDSGVDVMRIHGHNGAPVWRAQVRGLGVTHSKYEQLVYIEARGDALFVISQAAGGEFIEQLALPTGQSQLRKVL
jgi:outer membrane protein assembly factor BamB